MEEWTSAYFALVVVSERVFVAEAAIALSSEKCSDLLLNA
jgi:hypothetical protein